MEPPQQGSRLLLLVASGERTSDARRNPATQKEHRYNEYGDKEEEQFCGSRAAIRGNTQPLLDEIHFPAPATKMLDQRHPNCACRIRKR
jgi:hypothetical protein